MLKNIFKVLSGNVFSSLATYICLLYISMITTSVEYGGFTKFFYAVSILYFVLDLGLSSSLVVFLSSKNKAFYISDIIEKFKFEFISCVVISGIIFYFFFPLITIALIMISSIIAVTNRLISIKFQINQDWTNSALTFLLLNTVRSVLLFVFIFLFNSYEENVGSADLEILFFISTMIGAIVCWSALKRKISVIECIKLEKKELTSSSTYIYLGSIFAILCMRVDIFLVDYFLSPELAGSYARVSILFFVFPLLINSMNSVLLRHYSSSNNSRTETRSYIKFLLSFVLVILFVTVAIAFYFYENLLSVFKNNEVEIFIILLASYLGAILFSSYESEIVSKNQKYFMFIKISQLITMLLVFSLLYSSIGIIAPAISFFMSRVSGWMMIYYFFKRDL